MDNTNNPRVTVYIPCHNHGEYVEQAIESVLRQSAADWELIVIDDGSTDHSAEVLEFYRNTPRVSIHRTESIGLPKVCNFALAMARGEYIIRLDGDDVFDPNILLVLTSELDRNPHLALVFPDYYLMTSDGNVFAHERRRRLYDDDHMMDMPPNGACILARTAILRSLGGYREDLGAQDGFDLWSRIRENYKCANVNLPLFYYRRHAQNLTGNAPLILSARRRIKLDAVKEKLDAARPITMVIPCRTNYDFAKDLWNADLGGKSLLALDIESCIRGSLADRIVVACDNPAAADIVGSFDDPRLSFQHRPSETTLRSVSLVPTLEHVLRQVDPEMRGTTLVRYIQTPFLSSESLEEALSTMLISDADSAIAVEEVKDRAIYTRDRYGLSALNSATGLLGSSDPVYIETKTCIATRNSNIKRGSLTGSRVASFVVAAAETFFIGSNYDFDLARFIATQMR